MGSRVVRPSLAGAAALLIVSVSIVEAEPVIPVRITGPGSNRVDIVVLGDGFTAAQLQSGSYASAVENVVQRLFAEEPYREYAAFYNVRRVDVLSAQAGADHPSRGIYVDTALGSAYDCGGIQRLICVSVPRVNEVLVRSALTANERDLVVVLVNDPEYGGSGGSVAVAAMHTATVDLVLHEFGHTFALLADEYGGPPPPQCRQVEPANVNVTQEMTRALIKWRHWIAPSVQIPTPGTANGVPGLYEGAMYCDAGMFRPTANSKMRSNGRPFEQINTEQHIRRIYNLVSPIDGWSPLGDAVSFIRGDADPFSLNGPTPRGRTIGVTWIVDGAAVATGPTFDPNGLTPGAHRIEAVVRDTTPSVRHDPSGLLADSHIWEVTVLEGQPTRVPRDLVLVSIVRNSVTIAWQAPIGGNQTGYVVEGGVAPGQTLATIPTGGLGTTFTFTAPTGAFYIRVRALEGTLPARTSNEIRIFVNVPRPPSAPTNLLGVADGSRLHLAWQNMPGGGSASSMMLDVEGALTLSRPIGVGESFSFTGVPAGAYVFRVRAVNSTGGSDASNPVALIFPGTCTVPAQPADLATTTVGRQVTVSWNLPQHGAAPTGFQLSVAGRYSGTINVGRRRFIAVVPPGEYRVRVSALNHCGIGVATPEVTLVVP